MNQSALLKALLFSSGKPIKKERVGTLLNLSDDDVTRIASSLKDELSGGGLVLVETNDSFELRTAPEATYVVSQLIESNLSRELGKAGLETLAVILYRGSATRAEIDWTRGVNSSASIRSLLMRGLIDGNEDITNHRRIRYQATTDAFAHLGITCSQDLPRYDELSKAVSDSAHDSEVSLEMTENSIPSTK